MDSIRLPNRKEIYSLNTPKHRGSAINQYAESLFSKDEGYHQGKFERAILYEDPAMNLKDPRLDAEDEQEEDFSDFNAREVPKATGLNRGVKLGSQYVKKKTIVIWCVVAVSFLLAMMFAFPPIVSDDVDNTTSVEKNIFEKMSMTELKAHASTHYSIGSEKAFNSEKKENYRTVRLAFSAKNLSPFKVEIPKFVLTKIDPRYSDKVAYISMAQTDSKGEQIPVVIPGFSSKKFEVDVLMNIEDMDSEQFNEAVRSMVISTEGMNKKVFGMSLKCVPSYVFVSNSIELDLD